MASRDYAARNKKPTRGKSSGGGGGGLPGWVWAFVGLSVGLVIAVFVYISRPTETPLRGTSASLDVGDPETASELVNGKRFKPNEIEDIADRKAAAAKARAAAAAKAESANSAKPDVKSQADKSTDKSAAKDDKIAVPPKEKSRFTFYELLPSQEVLVPSQADGKTRPGAAPPPATAATQNPNAPGAVKAQPGTDTFIIQVASYKSEAEAERQKAALALIGVESRIEKVTIDNRDTYFRVRVGPVKDEAKARDTLAQLESNGINGMLVRVK